MLVCGLLAALAAVAWAVLLAGHGGFWRSGQDIDLIGGYFTGPGPGGQAYIGGAGVSPSAQYLNVLWAGGVSPQVPSRAEMEGQLASWRPAAVVAVTGPGSALGKYLIGLLGPPSARHGAVLAWRR